jgi:hypothetical protein
VDTPRVHLAFPFPVVPVVLAFQDTVVPVVLSFPVPVVPVVPVLLPFSKTHAFPQHRCVRVRVRDLVDLRRRGGSGGGRGGGLCFCHHGFQSLRHA